MTEASNTDLVRCSLCGSDAPPDHDCLIELNRRWDQLDATGFMNTSNPSQEEVFEMRQKLTPISDGFIRVVRHRRKIFDEAKEDYETAQETSIHINEVTQSVSRTLIEMLQEERLKD